MAITKSIRKKKEIIVAEKVEAVLMEKHKLI